MSDAATVEPDLEIVVEFTQRYTVTPPAGIDNEFYAKHWFWSRRDEITRDVLDAKNGDNYEVIEIREAAGDV